MRNILIDGIDTVLGSYFAARSLCTPDIRVFWARHSAGSELSADERCRLLSRLTNVIGGSERVLSPQAVAQRLYPMDEAVREHPMVRRAGPCVDETWLFAAAGGARSTPQELDRVLSDSECMGSKEFNLVAIDSADPEFRLKISNGAGSDAVFSLTEDEVWQRCKMHGMRGRIFHTSLIIGNESLWMEERGSAMGRFLSVLHSFKAEIEERSPQYFDFKALHVFAPANFPVNPADAGRASDFLIRAAGTADSLERSFTIAGPENVSLAELLERIGIAYNLSLLLTETLDDCNAVDRAFHQQLDEVNGHLSGGCREFRAETRKPAEPSPDEQTQIELFESIRRDQDRALAACRRRASEVPDRLERRTVIRGGLALNYCVGGVKGDVVVVLNALGQGLEYWYRLLDYWMGTYKVIIWEPRGTCLPPSPFGLNDQVDDLDAVLRQEDIETCHLVGWCTGPKVAIEFYLRRRSVVRSMVFLNPTLKCDGSPEDLDSAYERNLETLLRMAVRKPFMAASIRKGLQSEDEKNEIDILQDPDSEQMSVAVLSLMNTDLKPRVLAPFNSDESMLNYAHQMVEFWTHDVRPKASKVSVPVFLLSTEYDQVATSEGAVAANGLLPKARHVHVKGATHYCFYDRPEWCAELLRSFFADPDSFVARREQIAG